MELEQRDLRHAQDNATRVYGSPLPGILCSVIPGCGTEGIKVTVVAVRLQAACANKSKNESDSYFLHNKMGFHVSTNIHAVLQSTVLFKVLRPITDAENV